jgi:hypothetical protein
MKSIAPKLSLLVVVALFVGCATPLPTVPSETLSRLKRVGVVSVAANKFTRQYVGVTVFGNELEAKPISDWDINSNYEAQIAIAVESVLGANAIRANYSAEQFSHVNDVNGPWDARAFMGPNWGAIEEASRNFCSANSLDALVVAGRIKTDDMFGGTNQLVEGAGIYSRRDIDLLHVLSVVGLIDCKSGKPLATRALMRRAPGSHIDSKVFFPLQKLPSEIARMRIADWTPAIEAQIKQTLISLPGTGWADTLRLMLSPTK